MQAGTSPQPTLHESLTIAKTDPEIAHWLFAPRIPIAPIPPCSFDTALPVSLRQETASSHYTSSRDPLCAGTTVEQLMVPAKIIHNVLLGYVYATGSKFSEVESNGKVRRVSRQHSLKAVFAYNSDTCDFLMVQGCAHGHGEVKNPSQVIGIMDFRRIATNTFRKAMFSVPASQLWYEDHGLVLPTHYRRAHCSVVSRDIAEQSDYDLALPTPEPRNVSSEYTPEENPSVADSSRVPFASDTFNDPMWLSGDILSRLVSLPSNCDTVPGKTSHSGSHEELEFEVPRQTSEIANNVDEMLLVRSELARLERLIKGTFFSLNSLEYRTLSRCNQVSKQVLGREFTVIGKVDLLLSNELRQAAAIMHYAESLSMRIDEQLDLDAKKRIASWRCEERRKLKSLAERKELDMLRIMQKELQQRHEILLKDNSELRRLLMGPCVGDENDTPRKFGCSDFSL